MGQPHDIEDVLSSIRRLVANEAKPAVEAAIAPAPEPQAPALVLAPTQRVTDPEDPFQMIRTLAQAERDARDAKHLVSSAEEEDALITENIAEDDAAADWSEPSLAERAQVAGLHDGYEEDADYLDDTPAILPDRSKSMRAAPAPTLQDPAPAPQEIANVAQFSARMPPAESNPTASEDDTDTDTTDTNTTNPNTTEVDLAEIDLADIAESVTSDDALRDLIAEIVRQELSGALGERITRNVRKLVRREIRQVLSSGEFD